MPTALASIAISVGASAAATAVTTAIGLSGLAATVVGAGVSFGLNTLASSFLGPDTSSSSTSVGSNQSSNIARGILVNSASPVEPIPVVYGKRRVPGIRILPPYVGGSEDQYLYVVYVWCEGEINAVSQIYLNNEPITDSKFSGLVKYTSLLGATGQSAVGWFVNEVPHWTTNHRCDSTAYTVFRLKHDKEVFDGLPVFSADIEGIKCYDTRTSTTAYTTNPALHVRDYVTNTRYGRGADSSKFNTTFVDAAANTCDGTVSVPGGTQKRYESNGVVDTTQLISNNVNQILSSFRGSLIYTTGEYRIRIDESDSSTFDFTEDNITGVMNVSVGNMRSRLNRIRVNFVNANSEYQPDFVVEESSSFYAADNNFRLDRILSQPFVTNMYQAAHLAQIDLKNTRQSQRITLRAFPEAIRCEPGDVVTVTHSTFGYSAKPFRVTKVSILETHEVSVTLKEYDPSVYVLDDLDAEEVYVSTNLPSRSFVPAPTGLTAVSDDSVVLVTQDGNVIPRVKVSWDHVYAGTMFFEVQKKPSTSSVWEPDGLICAGCKFWISSDVVEGEDYNFRVRAINLFMVESDWTPTLTHTVIGREELPDDVQAMFIADRTVTWTPIESKDVKGYEVRVAEGYYINWGIGQALHAGTLPTSQTTFEVPPEFSSGTRTIMVKAVDSIGQYSESPAYVVKVFSAAGSDNIVESQNEFTGGFTGTKTDCSVNGGTGYLEADVDVSPPGWTADEDNGWSDDNALGWDTTTYKAMSYQFTLSPTLAVEGATISIVRTITGSFSVYYRVFGSTLGWNSDDSVAGWTSDSDPGWDDPTSWISWPGSVPAENSVEYEFRFDVLGGAVQGSVSELTVQVDVPDIVEVLNDVSISSSGTRLPTTKSFSVIKHVLPAVQDDGNGAVAMVINDFQTTVGSGPLVYARDDTGTNVDGIGDFEIKGYLQ